MKKVLIATALLGLSSFFQADAYYGSCGAQNYGQNYGQSYGQGYYGSYSGDYQQDYYSPYQGNRYEERDFYSEQGERRSHYRDREGGRSPRDREMRGMRMRDREGGDYQAESDRPLRDAIRAAIRSRYPNVRVSLERGTVILEGSVNSEEEKRNIEERIRSIRGVRSIENRLTVGRETDHDMDRDDESRDNDILGRNNNHSNRDRNY